MQGPDQDVSGHELGEARRRGEHSSRRLEAGIELDRLVDRVLEEQATAGVEVLESPPMGQLVEIVEEDRAVQELWQIEQKP